MKQNESDENLLIDSDFIRHFNSDTNIPSRLNSQSGEKVPTLSVFFASLCVIDLFGVFPIVTLPHAVILCGLFNFFKI